MFVNQGELLEHMWALVAFSSLTGHPCQLCLGEAGCPAYAGAGTPAKLSVGTCHLVVVCKPLQQVPSSFYLTDVFLYLDDLLGKKLLRAKPKTPEERLTRPELAAREAAKLKRLISSLRYLYRNSNSANRINPKFL